MTPLSAAQGILLVLLLAWKSAHLARAPRNVPLRCVVACLAFATIGFAAQLPASSLVSPASRWMILTQFSLVLATSCALDCFFLFSWLPAPGARRPAGRRALAAAAAVAAMAVTAALIPAGADIRNQAVPAVALLYLLFIAANVGLLADALRWTLRGITESEPVLARSLRLTSAGLALLLAALVPLTALVILSWARTHAPASLLAAGILIAVPGIIVFLIGVAYPGTAMRLAAVRVYARHYRLYRQLAPLWNELHRAYPQDALARVPASAWQEAINPQGVHRRYYRRVIECRDGLVRVSPLLGPGGPPQEAERILAALRTIPAPRQAPGQAAAIAVPAGTGIDADADALAVLSRQVNGIRRAQARKRQENP